MAYIDSSFNQFLPGVVTADEQGTVCQENHYYPYGDSFADTRIPGQTRDNRYKFCGKEEDSGSGLYDFSARFLNPVAGRFLTLDPAADETPSLSPYLYCAANPLNVVDPDGRHLEVRRNEDGTYTIIGGLANSDRNVYVNYGEKDYSRQYAIGTMLTEYSFMNDAGFPVVGSIINLNDRSGQEFLDDFMENTPDIRTYASSAKEYDHYDFKNRGIDTTLNNRDADIYRHRGMNLTIAGVQYIASARDVGNFAAGYVAGKYGLWWGIARLGFDGLETWQKRELRPLRIHIEGQPTQKAQKFGYDIGMLTEISQLIRFNNYYLSPYRWNL